jgi:hypothetical protein
MCCSIVSLRPSSFRAYPQIVVILDGGVLSLLALRLQIKGDTAAPRQNSKSKSTRPAETPLAMPASNSAKQASGAEKRHGEPQTAEHDLRCTEGKTELDARRGGCTIARNGIR